MMMMGILFTRLLVASLAAAVTSGTPQPQDVEQPQQPHRTFDNMNGEYIITPTPDAPKGKKFNTNFDEYPGGEVEFFEVYMGPITSLYSQVWWASVPAVPLPDELIKRFDGKGMAVVGYETDSVRKTAAGDVSVPINMAYNHHHDAYFTGKHSRMERVPYDPLDLTIPPMARAHPHMRDVPVETSPSPNNLPTSLHLADGNGGEYRKSYHGFPAPVAYVIDSPQSVNVNPMFIDTWNRDKMNISGGSKFVAGPMPKHSEAPADALYSGLLECPLTDRIAKIFPDGNDGWSPTYNPTLFQCDSTNVTIAKSCAHQIKNASECFAAAVLAVGGKGGVAVRTSTGASDAVAAGCTLKYTVGGGSSGAKTSTSTSTNTTIEAYFNTKADSKVCCGAGVTAVQGKATSLVQLEVQVSGSTATITLTGPSAVWFGVGFFAQVGEITVHNSPPS